MDKIYLSTCRKTLKNMEEKRLSRLREARDNKHIRKVVDMWAYNQLRTKILSDKQRMAIHYLTDFVHNFTYDWIATKINVGIHTLNAWRGDPLFLKELDKEITRRRSFIRLHAFRNVNRAIMRGDMKATWNYLKMSGDLKESVEVIDRTGERELDDNQLNEEIEKLQSQLATGPEPSDN